MARYTFTCEHFSYNDFTGDEMDVASKHTTEFRADDLTTMLENFESFLRGAGFYFEGHLDVVNEDLGNFDGDYGVAEEDEEFGNEEQSRKVMQHIVQDLMKNPISMKNNDDIFINLDNMNSGSGISSNEWDTGAAMPTLAIDDTIDLSRITISTLNTDPIFSEQYTLNFSEYKGNCEVCNLPKSVMAVHKCYDDNCPLYAPKN
jgi:hypothetical protein